MPRPPRKQFAGALYHVTSRGNGRARLFFTDDDRRRFLTQLQDCLETYRVVLYAYVLMPNHYHLVVRTTQPNLARFMQRLNTSYALYSRYKHAKPGHRLEGRYEAKLVQGDAYILTLTRYLHLNPVKLKAMRTLAAAARCRCLEAYAWSSYRGYVNERRVEEWVCYDILKTLSDDTQEARDQYRKYVYGCLAEDDQALKEILDRSGHGIGDEAFIEALESELRGRKIGTDRDRDVDYPGERLSVERIDEMVAGEYGTTAKALQEHGHSTGAGLAKAVAMELACRLTGLTQREIGARHGGISTQAVSHARKRVRLSVSPAHLSRLDGLLRSVESLP